MMSASSTSPPRRCGAGCKEVWLVLTSCFTSCVPHTHMCTESHLLSGSLGVQELVVPFPVASLQGSQQGSTVHWREEGEIEQGAMGGQSREGRGPAEGLGRSDTPSGLQQCPCSAPSQRGISQRRAGRVAACPDTCGRQKLMGDSPHSNPPPHPNPGWQLHPLQ